MTQTDTAPTDTDAGVGLRRGRPRALRWVFASVAIALVVERPEYELRHRAVVLRWWRQESVVTSAVALEKRSALPPGE